MLHALLDLFFPPVCAGCDSLLLQYESVICTHCRHEIPLTSHHLQPDNEAATKFFGRIPLESVTAFAYFHKKGIVQEMIHKLKYRGQEDVGAALGYWFAEDLKATAAASADEIIPVPLHPKKLKQRGYNQVSAFGNALSESLKIPMDENLLKRNYYSRTQTKKNLFCAIGIKKILVSGRLFRKTRRETFFAHRRRAHDRFYARSLLPCTDANPEHQDFDRVHGVQSLLIDSKTFFRKDL